MKITFKYEYSTYEIKQINYQLEDYNNNAVTFVTVSKNDKEIVYDFIGILSLETILARLELNKNLNYDFEKLEE